MTAENLPLHVGLPRTCSSGDSKRLKKEADETLIGLDSPQDEEETDPDRDLAASKSGRWVFAGGQGAHGVDRPIQGGF